MKKIEYFMSHGSPWTFLGHKRINKIALENNYELIIMPVNYGEVFPATGGLPVNKRSIQRQKYRLQELARWSEFLKVKLNTEPKFFPSRSLLPSLAIISAKLLKYENVMDIAYRIMEALWVKELDIDDEKTLKSVISKLTPSAEELIDFSKQDVVSNEIKKNTEKALKSSVFGAPTYIIDDEVFWGQDRLDFVERYIKRQSC
ncbi:MAG: 2-hydroxychromene-2-carboxylate isomerase [SAR116 cluster bacterium]|nr:2-hydroxychromene-2-carboxylate isomerase [SAR116 cluster bacterium]|tara:strand:+ start:432 stop:1037 length:606 start_codon:yes stop_codon:yes gene_type:complete